MMSAKMASPGLLKITVFWNKSYDVIISVDDVTNKFYHAIQIILQMYSRDQSLVTAAFLWEKLSQLQFYKDLTRKPLFLRSGLDILHQCGKKVKKKVRTFWGDNSYVCRSYRRKTGTGGFLPNPLPILNRVIIAYSYWLRVKEIHNYLMITLKIEKAICPVCEVKNSNRAFRR